MTGFRATRGLPVIETATAEEIGSVEHYLVRDGRLEAIHVGGRRRHPAFLDWSNVATFGEDAVMVDDAGRVHEPRDEVEERAARGELVMLDKLALSESGDELGSVTDVEFDPSDGTVVAFTVDGESIPGERLCGVGGYAVVVADPTDP